MWRKREIMKTDEDDEFDRIEHEAQMKLGQPYHFDLYVSPSQRNTVLEEVAREFESLKIVFGHLAESCAQFVREMKHD
jgi:predicted TIM-barrel fold metal-dependent hydrolase